MKVLTLGRQYELECEGLRRAGMHDDERCFARRARVLIGLPRDQSRDEVVPVDVAGVWRHLQDEVHDWGGMSALDRALYMGLCVPSLINATPSAGRAGELIAMEGMAEAYGYDLDRLLKRPPYLFDAWTIVRSTRNMDRLREMREREAQAETVQRLNRG